MSKNIKVVYYVDTDDNTKGCICAIPSDKDMRDPSVKLSISNEIKSVFGTNSMVSIHSNEIASSIVHYKYASMKNYEFGIEEIPLFGVHKVILQGC
jgi:hypothetical protein